MADVTPTLYGLGSVPIQLYVVAIALLVITWSVALLRAYVRGVMIKSIGMDDWTLIPAIVLYTIQCGYLIRMAQMEMDPEKYSDVKDISLLVTHLVVYSGIYACVSYETWSNEWTYINLSLILTCVSLKISLGLFFLRVIVEQWQRNIIYAALVTNTVYGITYFGLCTFGCGDPSQYLLHILMKQCISIPDVIIPASYVFTALNATVDWTMALLPIATIWHLQMPKITKFWAYFLLVLGGAGSIISLVRFAYVESLEPSKEFFKNTGKLAFYSHIEPGLGITAVCCATLRPLFKQCVEGAKSMTSTQRSYGFSGRKSTTLVEGSDLQLASIRKSRRIKDGFMTFDESDGAPSLLSNENDFGTKNVYTARSQATNEDLERGNEIFSHSPYQSNSPFQQHSYGR